MVDKAHIESGRYKAVPRQQKATDWAAIQAGQGKRSELNLFEACIALIIKSFERLSEGAANRLNAAAPYFIHIVRANRARDMIDRCSGLCQAGQRDKQTVAG